MDNIKLLQQRLDKIEKELDTCRTSVLQDGWQTQRHAKKSRKWDILAQEKMKIKQALEDFERDKILSLDFYDLAGLSIGG